MEIEKMREAVAKAIWEIRREEEDRCDMDLDDLGADHSVWLEADSAISAILELLVIELPSKPCYRGYAAYEDAMDDANKAINATGIRTK